MNIVFFQVGETIIAVHTYEKATNFSKNAQWVLTDPGTSVKITFYGPDGDAIAGETDKSMVKDSIGVYYYAFQTSGRAKGNYKALVVDTDGSQITHTPGGFTLE